MSKDITHTKVQTYSVSFNSVDIGYCNADIQLDKILQAIKVGQFGNQVLGWRFMGADAKIKVTALQPEDALAAAMSWTGESTGTLTPKKIGTDLYANAHALVFHPDDETGTTKDITFPKAVCVGPYKRVGDGTKDDALEMEFGVLPDRTKLPDIVLGYVGTAPA